jgi:hypothetical protein
MQTKDKGRRETIIKQTERIGKETERRERGTERIRE